VKRVDEFVISSGEGAKMIREMFALFAIAGLLEEVEICSSEDFFLFWRSSLSQSFWCVLAKLRIEIDKI
jgi:hypothetical protein